MSVPQSDTNPSIARTEEVRHLIAKDAPFPKAAPSVIIIRPSDIKYPDPPKGDQDELACPYCCQRYSKSNYDDKIWWERHVDKDFSLYSCISEQCADPPKLFADFSSWIQHMDTEHGMKWMQKVHRPISWYCDRGHDEVWFSNSDTLEEHIRSHHTDYSEGPELEMFKEWCEVRKSRRPYTCPVCNCIPQKIAIITGIQTGHGESHRASDQDRTDIRHELIRHVAEHVKQVGFMSVDYIKDNDEGSRPSSGTAPDGTAKSEEVFLEPGRWVEGDWIPTDTDHATHIDPQFLDDPELLVISEPPKQWDLDFTWDYDLSIEKMKGSGPDEILEHISQRQEKLRLQEIQRSLRAQALPKEDTFRVSGIPDDWDRQQLQSFLKNQENITNVAIESLASDIHGGSQVATVSFVNASRQHDRRWSILIPVVSDIKPNHKQYLTVDKDFHGITVLYTPILQDHQIDVIALPGLGGHAFGSFKERWGSHMWLRDSLPIDLTLETNDQPIARVMICGYDSTVAESKSMQNIEDFAIEFRSSLQTLANATIIRPIILIGHSLGGLIIKQALIFLSRSENEDDQNLIRAIYGVVFFGTPHDSVDISSFIPMTGDSNPNRSLIRMNPAAGE
ncbi:hypothetical protein ACHAQJ_002739 [Trichoderma viride]